MAYILWQCTLKKQHVYLPYNNPEDLWIYFSNFWTITFVFFPLKKGHGFSFEQTWITFTNELFLSCLVEISLANENDTCNVFKLFCKYKSYENSMTFHEKKLEFPSSKNAFGKFCWKCSNLFWRRNWAFVIDLFLEKKCGLIFEQYWFLFTGYFVHVW